MSCREFLACYLICATMMLLALGLSAPLTETITLTGYAAIIPGVMILWWIMARALRIFVVGAYVACVVVASAAVGLLNAAGAAWRGELRP